MMDPEDIIEVIWAGRANSGRVRGRFPDYVMIHTSTEQELRRQCIDQNIPVPENTSDMRIFGMKVIFTNEICENQVICTFNY